MQAKRILAFGLPVLALAGALCAPFLSHVVRPEAPHAEVQVLAFSIASCTMYIGCAILFLLGLKNFTAKLKMAYGVFCSALILFAFAELQVPAGTLIGQANSPWIAGGGVLVPLLLAAAGMYAGVKLFAKLYEVKGLWSKPWLVATTAILAAVAAYMLPVGSFVNTIEEAKGGDALMGIMLVLFASSAALLWQVKKKASQSYAKAMFWFFLAMMSFVGVTLVTVGGIVIFGTGHPFMQNGGSIAAESLFALFLLKAAYEFNVLGATATANNATLDRPAQNVSIVDVIVATSQKASNISAIDTQLDDMRAITASLEPGQSLSPEDRATLVQTYQHLEQYLTQQDPVRRYGKDELRQLIRKELHITGPIFFDNI